jgi:hypothetical protein
MIMEEQLESPGLISKYIIGKDSMIELIKVSQKGLNEIVRFP